MDGPGDEANAIIAKGGYGIYVFGASSGTLPGQPANAKGHRFLASYESGSGRRMWLKQSKDFGKGPVKPGSEFDPTPATIATDGVSNVYVLSSFDPSARVANGKGPVRLATLLKFDDKGKQLWRRTISVDPSSPKADSFRATLSTMIVDSDGSSIYLAGDAVRNKHSELVMMRLDHQGKPRWTQLVSLAYSESGQTDEGWNSISTGNTGRVRGIGVRGGHLLIASEYFYEDVETLPEEPEMEVRETMRFACVADFHSTDGALRWARYYWGVDPQHGSPTEFEPTGLQILRSGAVAINGRDDFYVPATGQEFKDVASAFLLTDAKMTVNSEYPPNAVELEFFQDVQRAVKVGDKQWIADNIKYPMIVGPEVVIENKSQFLKRYDSIVTGAVRQAIAQQVGNQLWRQEPTSRRDGALVGARDMLWMSEGRHIAIISIGGGTAEDPPESAPPTAEVESKAASEDKPTAAAEKSSKQLRREKMKKFFEDPDKKAQTK
ncbi:MAG: hypothetical protein HKN10_10695 [Myxococcales bacterium]|nr:hypothetical protein [Myxococcales bacterium]